MAKSLYTSELVAALQAQETWTYAQVVEFASAHNLKIRSVIAKLKSMELVYIPKPVVTKTGEPVTRKSEIIADIESAVKVDADALSGLTKSTKAALQALLAAVSSETA